MGGGNFQSSWRRCARPAAAAMLAAIVMGNGGTTSSCWAAQSDADDDCGQRTPEQSIVVSSAAAATDQLGIAIASDDSASDDLATIALTPIANISQYEPELAAPISEGAVPELAAPVATDLPTADDFSEISAPTIEGPIAEVIGFHGVTPGISNRREVFQAWGDPRNEETTLPKLDYRFDGLKSVQVRFDGNIVDAIVVELEQPLATDILIRKLSLRKIRPATLSDDQRIPIALAFPERGVVLRFTDGADVAVVSDNATVSAGLFVGEIVIQPIKAAAFVLRAENTIRSHVSNSIADLTQALELDHNSARARWLLSGLLLKTGQAIDAEHFASEAAEIEPLNHIYRLQWATCLRKLARYDRAVEQTRAVLESPTDEPLARAQALNEMGMLASLGSKKVAKSAVPLHNKAIEIADKLAIGDDATLRTAAKLLLVEAHLSMAMEIARGEWQEKDLTVPQWLERASALAESLIAEDESHLTLRLDVAVSALAAAASLESPIDPLLWVEEAQETVSILNKRSDDPLTRAQHDWKLGLAYFQAAQIEHRRSAAESAKRLCRQAETKLASLASDRDELPDTAYLLGRLYFQMGAVHAVHDEDHVVACQWYDRAADRLLNPVPVTTVATPQQHGDALVSMGVSYWHTDDRPRAIEVTQSGVELIEQAVESGLLGSDALVVPYGNLAAMYEAVGDMDPATKYTQLAKKLTTGESAAESSQRR